MQLQTPISKQTISKQTPTSSKPDDQPSTTTKPQDNGGMGALNLNGSNQTAISAGLSSERTDQTPTSAGLSSEGSNQTATSAELSSEVSNQTPTSTAHETSEGKVSQATAIRAVMEGTLLDRTRIAVRALTALLKDPEKTEMVFVLALAINRGRVGELLSQLLGTETGNWLLEHKPSINSTAVDFDWLRKLPEGTLGREYVGFLDANNLDADFFEEPPGLAPMLRFVIKRMRQSHDVWHTVTGYSTDPSGEVELQAFTYGQVGVPSAALIALTGSVRGMRTDIGLPLRALRAYRRGRKAQKLAPMIWENHWQRPIEDVRAELDCAS